MSHPYKSNQLAAIDFCGLIIRVISDVEPPLRSWLVSVVDLGGVWSSMQHPGINPRWGGGTGEAPPKENINPTLPP